MNIRSPIILGCSAGLNDLKWPYWRVWVLSGRCGASGTWGLLECLLYSPDIVTDHTGGGPRLLQVVVEGFPAARGHKCQCIITFHFSVSITFANVPLGKERHISKLRVSVKEIFTKHKEKNTDAIEKYSTMTGRTFYKVYNILLINLKKFKVYKAAPAICIPRNMRKERFPLTKGWHTCFFFFKPNGKYFSLCRSDRFCWKYWTPPLQH